MRNQFFIFLFFKLLSLAPLYSSLRPPPFFLFWLFNLASLSRFVPFLCSFPYLIHLLFHIYLLQIMFIFVPYSTVVLPFSDFIVNGDILMCHIWVLSLFLYFIQCDVVISKSGFVSPHLVVLGNCTFQSKLFNRKIIHLPIPEELSKPIDAQMQQGSVRNMRETSNTDSSKCSQALNHWTHLSG